MAAFPDQRGLSGCVRDGKPPLPERLGLAAGQDASGRGTAFIGTKKIGRDGRHGTVSAEAIDWPHLLVWPRRWATEPVPLEPGVPAEEFTSLRPGHHGAAAPGEKSGRHFAGVLIITYKYDKPTTWRSPGGAHRQRWAPISSADQRPIYLLLVRVVTDVHAQFVRTFVLPDGDNPARRRNRAASFRRPLAPTSGGRDAWLLKNGRSAMGYFAPLTNLNRNR